MCEMKGASENVFENTSRFCPEVKLNVTVRKRMESLVSFARDPLKRYFTARGESARSVIGPSELT